MRRRSLLGRLRSWLEPAAQAKELRDDSVRQAEWLGNGMLAVSGWDVDAERGRRVIPQGLSVIDTDSWTIRKADERASRFWLAGGLLFTAEASWDAAAQRWESSVEIYAANGTRRLSLVPRAPVVWVQAANGRAFVAYTPADDTFTEQRGYSIFELASGGVVAEKEQAMPVLLDVSG